MVEYIKTKCTSCEKVVYLASTDIPDDIETGEFFKYECPVCGDLTAMEVV